MTKLILTVIAIGICAMLASSPQATGQEAAQPGVKDQKTPPSPAELGPQLIKALKASPGCLGVEMASTVSGKNVIFAWFKDKKTLSSWYYSEAHQKIMKQSFPGQNFGKPLKNIPEDCGPILAIASITFSQKPKFEGTTLPFSQISIELYTPLKGGTSLGGTFAPPGIDVPKADLKKSTN
jgi:hypothetical protein